MRLVRKSLFVLAVILISAIVIASILYYELGTKPNAPQASPSPTNIPTQNPTASQAKGILTSIQSPWTGEGSYGHGWNSNIILYLGNSGDGPTTISDFVINGKSYSSYSPVPTVSPSIENGYTLLPHQSVTITIKLIDQPFPLYHGANELYVLTTDGQSLRIYLGS
jgi:hypothetical protein